MTKEQSTIFTGDNLDILSGMNSESVDLIYLDPPFNSKRTWSAPIGSQAAGASFKDMWTWSDIDESRLEYLFDKHPSLANYIQNIAELHSKPMMSYITYMTQRIVELHRVLKSTGSFYLHCDPTASHYLKHVLDCIFGKNHFRNEIIWHYELGMKAKAKKFHNKHDVILFYTKSKEFTYNRQYEPYDTPKRQPKLKFNSKTRKAVQLRDENNNPLYIILTEKLVGSVWNIKNLAPNSKERTGYPTQKPLTLMDRIIKSSSNEGDIVLDPFCGCATTCVAAESLHRKWIGIDIEAQAAKLVVDRLTDMGLFTYANYVHLTTVPKRDDIVYEEPTGKKIKPFLFKKQKGICKGCEDKFEERHFEVDHIIPKKRGGGDYIENFQLLCGNCNRIKGARPMDYLRTKIKIRRDIMLKNSFKP